MYTKEAVDKTTLFVGSLPLQYSEQTVRDALDKVFPPFVNVTLKTGPPPECTSRGFCFVQFETHATAEQARKIVIGTQILGRYLSVGWADALPSPEEEQRLLAKTTTLYVNNVNTTVTEDQLQALFQQFGEVSKCRIVRNTSTNESRGIAFVEFQERESCESAMAQLNDTDFCGSTISVLLARPDTRGANPEKKKALSGVRKRQINYGLHSNLYS